MEEEKRTARGFIIGTPDSKSGFEWCDGFLRLRGYRPIHSDEATKALSEYFTNEEVYKLLIDIISMCEVVIMVDGWQPDKQCNVLLEVAKGLGKHIYYHAKYKVVEE